jgi:hypothetical protein
MLSFLGGGGDGGAGISAVGTLLGLASGNQRPLGISSLIMELDSKFSDFYIFGIFRNFQP